MSWYLYSSYVIGKGYVSTDILDQTGNLQWSNDSDTLAVTLTFDSALDLAEGRSHLILKRDKNIVFAGVITKKENKKNTSSYTAQDYAFYLNKNEEDIIQFNGTNAKQAIYSLLGKYGIGGAVTPLTTVINKVYKGKTVSEIIDDIMDQCTKELGEEVVKEMRGNVLWIDKVSNLKVDCNYVMGDDYSVTRSMEEMYNNVYVITNEESDKNSYANAQDKDMISIFGLLSKVLSIDKGNIAQAQNVANKYLDNYDATKRELTVTLTDIEGCEGIRAKRSIPISISKYGIQGYYKVKSAQHSLNDGVYKIAVTIDFSSATFVDPPELTAATSSETSTSSVSGSTSSKASDIIAYAKQFLGVPYVSGGGNPPSSFDCSSYVAYVFNHFGYNLDSYTYSMINQGTKVSMSNIQPCDMVFFFNTGHVGMYIGNDQFIHCPHTGDVVKISTFSGYYANNCNAVVRVI